VAPPFISMLAVLPPFTQSSSEFVPGWVEGGLALPVDCRIPKVHQRLQPIKPIKLKFLLLTGHIT